MKEELNKLVISGVRRSVCIVVFMKVSVTFLVKNKCSSKHHETRVCRRRHNNKFPNGNGANNNEPQCREKPFVSRL